MQNDLFYFESWSSDNECDEVEFYNVRLRFDIGSSFTGDKFYKAIVDINLNLIKLFKSNENDLVEEIQFINVKNADTTITI